MARSLITEQASQLFAIHAFEVSKGRGGQFSFRPNRRANSAGFWNNDWLIDIAKVRGGFTASGVKKTEGPKESPATGGDEEDEGEDSDEWVDSDSDGSSVDEAPAFPTPTERVIASKRRLKKKPSIMQSHNPFHDPPPLPPSARNFSTRSSQDPYCADKPVDSPEESASDNEGDTSHFHTGSSTVVRRGAWRKLKTSKRLNQAQQRKRRVGNLKLAANRSDKHDATVAERDAAFKQIQELQVELQDMVRKLEDSTQMVQYMTSIKEDLEAQRRLLKVQIADFSDIMVWKDDEIAALMEDLETHKALLRSHDQQHSKALEAKDFQISSLREQLDQAHFKLRKAERRNRYVDDADRWKADAKYRKKKKSLDTASQLFGFPSYEADEHREEALKERRGARGLVAKSVDVVTGMLNRFNEDLFQTAASYSDIIENRGFENASMSSSSRDRADRVLGTRLVSMILPTVPRTKTVSLEPLVVQVAIQAFLVYWCNQIIEAWYPKQATFAEFLVDVSSNLQVGQTVNMCGKNTIITRKHTRDSTNLFIEWAEEILEDLRAVLSIFGWKVRRPHSKSSSSTSSARHIHTQDASTLQSSLIALLKYAYDIRTAMAEISTSGDVDLVIVSCGTPYNDLRMVDAYGSARAGPSSKRPLADGKNIDSTAIESVVATTGIGLQREVLKAHSLSGMLTRDLEMVLKPRVVLEYTLLEAFSSI